MVAKCAYCGVVGRKLEREHVIPSSLYPASKAKSKIQRITVPACSDCNRSWSDDEAHFRNVLLLAGDANDAVKELWHNAARSFYHVDGSRRVRDVWKAMVPVEIAGESRFKIYPEHDPRVMRVVRKIVRGLSYHHKLAPVVSDQSVQADICKFNLPDEGFWLEKLRHCEPDVFKYLFETYDEGDAISVWYLKFFDKLPFIAWVAREGPQPANEL